MHVFLYVVVLSVPIFYIVLFAVPLRAFFCCYRASASHILMSTCDLLVEVFCLFKALLHCLLDKVQCKEIKAESQILLALD